MNSKNESIIYYAVKSASKLVMLLPIGIALSLGRFLGRLGYCFNSKQKRVAYRNLRIAFCATKSDKEIRAILKKCYVHFGQNLIELLRLPVFLKEGIRKRVHVVGEKHVAQAIGRKKGVIFLSIHSGNWELSSLVGSSAGYPYNLIANPQIRNNLLDRLLTSYRKAAGCKIINPGDGTREIIRRLKANEIVTLVADQGGHDGQSVDFLGRQASMSTGAIRLALKYGASICVVDISRQHDGSHCLSVEPFDLIRNEESDEDDIKVNLQLLIKRFEEKILEHPYEYMWFYKIWKYSKDSNILILDDGRTGHLRQSQALVNILAEALEKKGNAATSRIVQICFKSEFLRRMCSVVVFLGQWFSGLRSIAVLKIFLKQDSVKKLTSVSADYIVSCGSTVAGINFLSASWQSARSMIVLKPGILPLKRFDLVVLPVHDVPKRKSPKETIAVTRAALNLIDKQYMSKQSQQLLNRYSHLKNTYRTKIGVLIGGDTKNIEFTESVIKMVIQQVKEVAVQLNADILLTTSRRTPVNIEQILWRELKKFERCALLISAANSDVPEAVGGILGLADYILVSGESVSMVSEAISSGKKTVVFNVATATVEKSRNKYERFVDVLNEQGYLVVCPIKGIAKALYSVISDKVYLKPLNDREAVAKVIERII